MPHAERKSAHWVYTWNNPNVGPEEHHASLASAAPSAHVFQREVGESGTSHYQGYVEFKSAKSLRQLKACNPQAHWEPRVGSQAQAVAYSTKCCGKHYKCLDTDACSADLRTEGPWTFGELKSTSRAGMSPDFIEQVKRGKRMRDLLVTHADDVRKYPRFYEIVRRVYAPPPRESPPHVVLLIGPSGCGKTWSVYSKHKLEDLFVKPVDRGFWMDGYDLHPAVLLDDFAGAANHITLVNLLQLLDRYTTQVPVKGGFVWWQPETIYITTNIHPSGWYDWSTRLNQWPALMRRITEWRVWNGDGHRLHPQQIPPDFFQASLVSYNIDALPKGPFVPDSCEDDSKEDKSVYDADTEHDSVVDVE